MKELGLGMLMYCQDYDETFAGMSNGTSTTVPVIPGTNFCRHSNGTYYFSWAAVIYPYVKNTQIYICPSSTYNCYGVAYGVPGSGINAARTGHVSLFGRPKLADIKRPAEIMMIGEKGTGGGHQYIHTVSTSAGVTYYAGRASHNEGMNVAFFDGHAKWMKAVQPAAHRGWLPAASGSDIGAPEEVCYNPFG